MWSEADVQSAKGSMQFASRSCCAANVVMTIDDLGLSTILADQSHLVKNSSLGKVFFFTSRWEDDWGDCTCQLGQCCKY
jgi:hypothetical protein